MLNLTLPGNPRYQPKDLQPYFGYDNNFRFVAEVEIATLKTLGAIKVIPPKVVALLTPEVEKRLLTITTTEVDKVEREITKHDIRAWVHIAQKRIPKELRRWVHIPLTSYDVLDTARTLQYIRAHEQVVGPLCRRVISGLKDKVRSLADVKQIGRTHGQHALPITVGFWLATILSRVLQCAQSADRTSGYLVGKISGAVGAYNAQIATGIYKLASEGKITFERRVLHRLGLEPSPISTQILPPEPLADYLFSCVKLSAALGQLGRDGRNLMRSEINEIGEPFDKGQVGSSTMAHKRNPINFENIEGTWLKTKNEFGNVLDTLISDHQRDLVGSTVSRDFPTIVVNLVLQLNTLLRGDPPFIERISVDTLACHRNFALSDDHILAEPLYVALQMGGYDKDAHKLINHGAIPYAKKHDCNLWAATRKMAEKDEKLMKVFLALPDSIKSLFANPSEYCGLAAETAMRIADQALLYLSK